MATKELRHFSGGQPFVGSIEVATVQAHGTKKERACRRAEVFQAWKQRNCKGNPCLSPCFVVRSVCFIETHNITTRCRLGPTQNRSPTRKTHRCASTIDHPMILSRCSYIPGIIPTPQCFFEYRNPGKDVCFPFPLKPAPRRHSKCLFSFSFP